MTRPETPADGDFASYLDARKQKAPAEPAPSADFGSPAEPPRQTIQQVLVDGEEPTEEFLQEWNAAQEPPELSDEELARQALEAPGDDGDASTPE